VTLIDDPLLQAQPVQPGGLRRRTGLVVKRGLDVSLAALGLLALMPLLVVVAALIKTESPGPVLFRQVREGLGGRHFNIYKFRTMRVEAGDPSGLVQTVSTDPRLTRVGQFLRRSSIDELPQLINVVLGEMSLVGPRPHVPDMLAAGVPYRELVADYDERHRMRPGITGWAQVNGLRGPTTDPGRAAMRIAFDLRYVRNWSLLLDARILAVSIWRELTTGTGE
jgi:lipopolysaccharide/colanic/teichoic acid biosynthesis glycosyltransferase